MAHRIENKMKYIFPVLLLCLSAKSLTAQNYHAVEGSSFAGSLGVGNNPASIVNTPFPWDIDIISLQLKSATNAFTIQNYSLISSAKNSKFVMNNGGDNRYADVNFNVNLLNARFALNRKQAFAFGANLRGYGRLKTAPFNYNDTLHNVNEFFSINDIANSYHGNFTGSSWLEGFLTYSQTILDDSRGRLNAGITVKAMRGITGAYANLDNGTVTQNNNGTSQYYTLKTASATYGYSYNYDGWQDSKSSTQNLKDFVVTNARGGFSFDVGVEYLIKSQALSTVYDEDDYFDYDWKIGVSLLDIGRNQYVYGNKSRAIAGPRANVTDDDLDRKFDSVSNFNDFDDSLATIVNGFSRINGKFKIQNPTRLVVNVDKPLGNDFYMNANVTVNLSSVFAGSIHHVEELNLLTLTPRWETKRWGVYMPIQYNIEGQFWVGGAFKAGPLLLGIHNWANIFSKNKMQNGGGYIAIVIRPSKMTKAKMDKRLDCPTN
ncbi:MAG TPA: hypothetical protein VKT28_14190 [Puia sp.]|nr:hypothetical protein [Puia sp.]